MKSNRSHYALTLVSVALLISACQESGQTSASSDEDREAAAAGQATAGKPTPETSTSPGKPSAPISIEYEVMGNAVVGVPLAVNVQIRSTRRNTPVRLRYAINDSSSMMFQSGQVTRRDLQATAENSFDTQQIAIIPQREGRLYLNVSAEVETEGGPMLKSIAIPIQVGSAPAERKPAGEVTEGPDGERVISMPAREN